MVSLEYVVRELSLIAVDDSSQESTETVSQFISATALVEDEAKGDSRSNTAREIPVGLRKRTRRKIAA